tara:strand:- start:509 stop:991 length:483 start_codon:yes stop_codon:yes gene_type:complete
MTNNQLSFNYTMQNEEVLYTKDDITVIKSTDINHLVQMARKTERKRIRICAHPSSDNPVHDMLIVHFQDTYVRPHKHLNKDETFHIIRGDLKVVIFNDDGTIKSTIIMGEYGSGKTFFYRMSKSYFHTIIPSSEVVVFHETTRGPFNKDETIFPDWASDE